ncbi:MULTISPECIES: ClC family H(+)/Cl(-) exchange transporter [Eubacteriales]|uniref:ClC family H(+)/Cl(-) exchange transporter n=1 Tax=Eubacteriales TaxID=186802 RepID=UPI001C111C6E|nr:ClC family H(+)/Cl(-) exchange transporter [Caproiciproducens sp. MSJ-32]MBU5455202.1 chloride channel protein [Caproiciproducens sp. MSJ-32]
MDTSSTKEILKSRKNMKIKLLLEGTLIGFLVGFVIVLNRLAISNLTRYFNNFYDFGNQSIIKSIIVIITLTFIGYLVGIMVKREEMISGSGIPQIKGRVVNKLRLNWFKILIYKFLGGVIALAAGLSLGREGPSVQIGGAVGEGVADLTYKKVKVKKEYLITSGASAGLAAAFNSPLSGMIFALEEIHRNFSPLVLLPAMASAIAADFVSKRFLGMEPSLNFERLQVLPLKYYWLLIILGILTGVAGTIFSKGIYLFQDLYGKFKKIPIEVKIMFPFFVTALIGLLFPSLLGGGHDTILNLTVEDNSICILILLYLSKFLLLMIAFGSGVPGGIFLPMLLLGAILGNITGVFSFTFLGLNKEFIVNFIALGMAGYFAAVVKAPITGIVLIMEMTGSFNHILSLGLTVIVSYITADFLKNEAIYELLLERLLKRKGIKEEADNTKKTILEFPIEAGSIADGKYVKDIEWPKDCLLVSIKRGEKEIIPKGKVQLLSGDYLVVIVTLEKRIEIFEEINSITLVN